MKLTIVLPLLFSTLGLAAPTAVEKRQSTAQVTLYKNVQYGNPNTLLTVALDTDSSDGCSKSSTSHPIHAQQTQTKHSLTPLLNSKPAPQLQQPGSIHQTPP
jgi:hypothetical protein